MNTLVEVISADISRLSEYILEDHSVRLYSRGGHFSREQMIPVYFMLIYGCYEDDKYNNFLYSLKDDVMKTSRPFAFLDGPMKEPDGKDRLAFSGIDIGDKSGCISGLCGQISIGGDKRRTLLAQKALGDILSMSRTDVFEIGMTLAFKLNVLANGIDVGGSKEIPLIMYYGNPSPEDVLFLCFAQRSGFDVICVSPDKSCAEMFNRCPFADKLQKEELPYSKPVTPFPERLVKTKIATVAYNAERELDTMLYGGDTVFRDRQFSKMSSAVLKTTLDEIFILWDQQAKYRSGFAVRGGDRVIVPTIFAKLNGVDDGDMKRYWDMVEELLTPDTIFISKGAAYKRPDLNVSRLYSAYHDGNRLNIPKLKASPLNKFTYLSEELQDLIFEKMQEVIDEGMLRLDSPAETVDHVMYTGLNLDKTILRCLQRYDFTKDIPKMIVVDAVEDVFSKVESTQLLLFSYLGFDVLIMSPCGYRDIEVYVDSGAFETHTLNEFVYNVNVPRFKIPTEAKKKKQKNGIFKNLFKKGK
ncbi:MAG: YceG family protein [Ruminococcus sp.]|nr:YceG family protein [Ruminococcus sp.]